MQHTLIMLHPDFFIFAIALYRKAKEEAQELMIAEQNISTLLEAEKKEEIIERTKEKQY